MMFTCHTTFDKKTLTIMARAVHKTIWAKRNCRIRIYVWSLIGLLLLATWLSLENIWKTVANCVVIVALLLINWKEDAMTVFLQTIRLCQKLNLLKPNFIPPASL